MMEDTLLGKSFIRMETPAPQEAASATPSRNLKRRVKSNQQSSFVFLSKGLSRGD